MSELMHDPSNPNFPHHDGSEVRDVVERFTEHAARRPDAIALTLDEHTWSYGRLDTVSGQLAHQLQSVGVVPESFVALFLPRSFAQVAAILAVLKAGGAYVPIDPDYPEERVRLIIEDCGAKFLMVSARGPRPPVGPQVVVIVADDQAVARPCTSSETPMKLAGPDNAAYMIYTSGSTGRPKGVVVTRHNVNRLFTATEELFDFGPDHVWLLFHSYAFDFSVWELWGALSYGGRLVIVPMDVACSATDLRALLERNGVTVLNQTPSAFYNLLRVWLTTGFARLDALRYVIFGGEALDLRRLVPWFELYGDARPRLVNMYGITETTVHATFRALSRADTEQGASLIGRPLQDLDVYLVDAEGRFVENGIAGEIWIAGEGVAKGYFNRAELSAERFVPDPLQPSRRAYRTGDLALRRADGDLEYLGRIDAQVKVRGYRVELGEIEAALRQHPDVEDAVVVARPGEDTAQLVGYVVPGPIGPPGFADVRAFLRERLPPYMVCDRFCLIDEIPLTAHGKVNRQVLPDPNRTRSDLAATHVAPRTHLEQRLAGLFSEATGIESIGIEDDFFELGGTSLLAARLCARIISEFAVQVTPKDLFIHPTVAALAAVILVRLSLAQEPSTFTVSPAPRADYMPLTHAQERVWLIQKLSPASVAYTLDASLRFRGRLDVTALGRALARLVDRHEVLRTTFPQVGDRPVQYIHSHGVVQLEEISLEHLDSSGAEQEVERRRAAVTQQAFDLERLPLIVWTLYRLSEHEHILLHREHHLLHDGWSFFVLIGDLLELYRAALDNRAARLPELPVQISDFAVAQRRWVEAGRFEDQLLFWRERLRNCPPLLAIPTDRLRPPETTYRGDSLRCRLPDDLVHRARAFGRQERASFYMTMLAPFVALLGRLSGGIDVCIGTGVANRRTLETEPIVGMVINNVVLRFDLREPRTMRELMGHVKEVVLMALDNQDVPFDVVVRSLDMPHYAGIHPVCQVFFTSYDGPESHENLPNLDVTTEIGLSTCSSKFDLNVILISQAAEGGRMAGDGAESNDRVTLIWEYSTDLFERATMERMAANYFDLLRQGLDNPDVPLNEIELTSEQDRRWLLEMSRGPSTSYPRDASIAELFEKQVAARPGAIALIEGHERLTYRELDRRASRIAHRLRANLITGEQVVGIFLERGAPAVIAMIGVLKAGAAYMPLNPQDPIARLAALMGEAGTTLVVTRRRLIQRLPRNSVKVVLLDEFQDSEIGSDAGVVPGAGGAALACVLFTSGSTGHPKGVEVLHRGIVRLLCGQDYARFGPDETFLQLAPLTFDASTFEIWGALMHGGTLVVHPEDVPDLANLERSIRDHGVTTLWLNSSLFNAVIDERPALLRPIRQLLIGGEKLSVSHVRRALAHLPATRIVNGYGPTENTTFSCCHLIPGDLPEDAISIPIGRPLANSTTYVLDERMQPAPLGMSGEIYLGGDGVAGGYRGRPELTAERFLPDPFATRAGARMYRSGDLGAVLPDGTIQFRSRLDDQVKIRGFRIEPAEVESVLGGLPGVRSCAVITRENAGHGKKLFAFVVPNLLEIDTEILRARLHELLPGYMVPDQFAVIDNLPLTAHGKLDRAALSTAVTGVQVVTARSITQPRTVREGEVLNVFREILGHEDIGIHDDFFTLGGHSLLAIRLIGRLSERLGVYIDLRWLFRNPTVAGLCAAIDGAQGGAPPVATFGEYLLPVREIGVGRPIFFVPGGDGDVLAMGVYARLADYVPDRPFLGFRSSRIDGPACVLQPSVERLATAFILEMKRIQPTGPYDVAGGCIGGIIAFEMARQLAASCDEVHRVVLLDTVFPNTYQRMRTLVRGACARLRFHLRRLSSFRHRTPRELGTSIYDFISGLLPFTPFDASPELHPVWIRFANCTMRYRPKPYAGKVHMILSEQGAGSDLGAGWGRKAKGGIAVMSVQGDHEAYIRAHIDTAGKAFRRAMEEDE
jgi:amino acid adenylation domain-containing protein